MGYSALKIALIFVYYAVQLSGKIGVVLSVDQVKDYFPEERDGLLQLRDFINSTSNLHGNWTGPPCYKNDSRWTGIACLNGHVTDLVLEGIQITGSLPQTPFLCNITFLTKLSLRNNFIRGPLPNLTNLLYLELVLLSQNRFSGSIPLKYINLPRLKKLELQQNSLTGSIPPFDQPTLTMLNVSYNHLTGRIPSNQVLSRFPESSYDHNSALCGQPLGTPCKAHPPPRTTDVASNGETKETLEIWRFSLIAVSAVLVSLSVMLGFILVSEHDFHYRQQHPPQTPCYNFRETKQSFSISTAEVLKTAVCAVIAARATLVCDSVLFVFSYVTHRLGRRWFHLSLSLSEIGMGRDTIVTGVNCEAEKWVGKELY